MRSSEGVPVPGLELEREGLQPTLQEEAGRAAWLWPPEEAEAEDGVHLGRFALEGSFLEPAVLWSPLFLRPEPRAPEQEEGEWAAAGTCNLFCLRAKGGR